MTATEHVILVDENDNPIGTAEKLAAHRDSLCHRAFSVYIFRQRGGLEVLLQQRASNKYHCADLWTNTCCSHPQPGEDIVSAGQRRLQEEMGITTSLTWVGRFHYIAHFDNGLTENEIDHVLIGQWQDDAIPFNPEEVRAYRWTKIADIQTEFTLHPDQYTPWFMQGLKMALTAISESKP